MADISYEELAAHLLGVDIDDDDVYYSLDDRIYDKYQIDMYNFEILVRDLMKCIQFGKSLFDDKIMVGFGTCEDGLSTMFVKTERQ